MADLNREEIESRAQSDYLEQKKKQEQKQSDPFLVTTMPLKGDETKGGTEKLPDDLDYDSIPTGEFIRILRGIEDKIRKTHSLRDNALKRSYIEHIRKVEAEFINFQIPTGGGKSYLDLLENARQLSLSFRLEEDEKPFIRRLDRHIEFFESVRQDFEGNGKWVRSIKVCMYIFMMCFFILLPPLINMAMGQINFWSYIISFVIGCAAVLVFGIYVIKQVEKRKRMSIILVACVSPIALLAGGFWTIYGVNILLGFEEYMQLISQNIAAGGMAASPGYTQFVVAALPVIGVILIVDLVIMLIIFIKNRKLFTA